MTRTDPEGLALKFVGQQANQLHWLGAVFLLCLTICLSENLVLELIVRSKSKDCQELNVGYSRGIERGGVAIA